MKQFSSSSLSLSLPLEKLDREGLENYIYIEFSFSSRYVILLNERLGNSTNKKVSQCALTN